MSKPIRWAAQLSHVREVTLLGAADLGFWSEVLRREELRPREHDGQAEVLIVAVAAKYLGIRFRELSVSILVDQPARGGMSDAAYLVGAFNSVRFFAFCERTLFATPYAHAEIDVAAELPMRMQVRRAGSVLFEAAFGGEDRTPAHSTESRFEGPIFLPDRAGGPAATRKLFFARLRGEAQVYPFVGARDRLSLSSDDNTTAMRALRESRFEPRQWLVRSDAEHAKSKTYRRTDVLPG